MGTKTIIFAVSLLLLISGITQAGGEAQTRWERRNQMLQEKFDLVLPEVMRENGVDMWITVNREGFDDPLTQDFGGGYVKTFQYGYYVFTDRGNDRIERAALGIGSYLLEENGAYDIFNADFNFDLAKFVKERDPKTIALNFAEKTGAADGLSHTSYKKLARMLGKKYEKRFVSADKLASDFRSRRTASEIAAFAQSGEYSRTIAERAFSKEVITPGKTTLEDVAWWMYEQLHKNHLGTSFGMPSVYLAGPKRKVGTSSDYVIQRGDFISVDWGVGYLNFYTDIKRHVYILKEGETHLPASLQKALDNAKVVRNILKNNIKPGKTAAATYKILNDKINGTPGFYMKENFKSPPLEDPNIVEVFHGSHSVGQLGHGIGPAIAFFNPHRHQYLIRPTHLMSIETFTSTTIPEWDNKRLRLALEDDAVITERGVEWLYPVVQKILLIR